MCWLDVEDGFIVVLVMCELDLCPSKISLEVILHGCDTMNDPEQAQKMVQEIEQEGLCFNIFSMIRYQLMPSSLNLAIRLCILSPHNS